MIDILFNFLKIVVDRKADTWKRVPQLRTDEETINLELTVSTFKWWRQTSNIELGLNSGCLPNQEESLAETLPYIHRKVTGELRYGSGDVTEEVMPDQNR